MYSEKEDSTLIRAIRLKLQNNHISVWLLYLLLVTQDDSLQIYQFEKNAIILS